MNNVMALINLDNMEKNIHELTQNRPMASIPILGRYRVIDFIISSLVNSGVENIGVLIKDKSKSIVSHLNSGKPWDLDRKNSGIYMLNSNMQSSDSLYDQGDIDRIKDHMDYISLSREEYIVLSKGYMVCNVNLKKLYESHIKSGSDVTILYKKEENLEKFINCDLLNLDQDKNIISVGKNLFEDGKNNNVSMEIYIMKKDLFIEIVEQAIAFGNHKSIRRALFSNLSNLKMKGFEYDGYLGCINSTESYYQISMDLLNPEKFMELFYRNGLINTKIKDEAPSRYSKEAKVKNSIIANGCIIEGEVENSIIFRGAKVAKGALIKNSIIMGNSVVQKDAYIRYVIMDKNATIKSSAALSGSKNNPLVVKKYTTI